MVAVTPFNLAIGLYVATKVKALFTPARSRTSSALAQSDP
jgi:hypothetical protein